MKLTDNKEKFAIVDRLVKDGHIDFSEAVKLLETETECIFILYQSPVNPFPTWVPDTPIWVQPITTSSANLYTKNCIKGS